MFCGIIFVICFNRNSIPNFIYIPYGLVVYRNFIRVICGVTLTDQYKSLLRFVGDRFQTSRSVDIFQLGLQLFHSAAVLGNSVEVFLTVRTSLDDFIYNIENLLKKRTHFSGIIIHRP